jgi:diphosphomevalonate decarboxylase
MNPSYNNSHIITWKAPSNIALVKYWGKKDFQLPMNPSISISLNSSTTTTKMEITKNKTNNRLIDFYFEELKNTLFSEKIEKHIKRLDKEFPLLKDYDFKIHSCNTFPHSSGIASSASSMASLNLCLTSFLLDKKLIKKDDFYLTASRLSRMGSGSASRSLFPSFAEWGLSSEEYASPVKDIHNNFTNICDAILIVSSEVKLVSSRVGHELMIEHPYNTERYSNARNRIDKLLKVLNNGDWDQFIEIVEAEALELHAMMMCSSPSYILMQPNSLKIIDLIRSYREKTHIKLCFTLDAGPNIHLLYPESDKQEVHLFIKEEVLPFLENGLWIDDKIGAGPENLS